MKKNRGFLFASAYCGLTMLLSILPILFFGFIVIGVKIFFWHTQFWFTIVDSIAGIILSSTIILFSIIGLPVLLFFFIMSLVFTIKTKKKEKYFAPAFIFSGLFVLMGTFFIGFLFFLTILLNGENLLFYSVFYPFQPYESIVLWDPSGREPILDRFVPEVVCFIVQIASGVNILLLIAASFGLVIQPIMFLLAIVFLIIERKRTSVANTQNEL